jgi:hypothetical protein
MTLEIQKNIPVPARGYGRGRQLSSESEIALKMKPGDSVLCPNEVIYRRVIKCLSNYKRPYTSRRSPEGFRVWRIDGRKAQQLLNGRVAATL